jgi:peroxiredoxin (alkyl hydroperoxide reductase subunit C)
MPEQKEGCVKPARGPILPASESPGSATGTKSTQEVSRVLARVGKEAIDFEANAFVEGVGFKPVRLSESKGKWIILCFYPGDFTFV